MTKAECLLSDAHRRDLDELTWAAAMGKLGAPPRAVALMALAARLRVAADFRTLRARLADASAEKNAHHDEAIAMRRKAAALEAEALEMIENR